MKLPIVKSHGSANDFVVVEDLDGVLDLPAEVLAGLCDRHRGVGADGTIRVTTGDAAPVFMDYRNADGSVAEMCGNGIRCLAKYCFDRGLLVGTEAKIETRAGVRHVSVARGLDGRVCEVTVDMGPPVFTPAEVPVRAVGERALAHAVTVDGDVHTVAAVGMGNPHAVLVVDDPAASPVPTLGPRIETHGDFPHGTNVEFVAVRGPRELDMRVWERGVGETLACGTGACAAAVALAELGLTERAVDVRLPGGTLHIDYRDTVLMTGPAVEVFEATVDLAQL